MEVRGKLHTPAALPPRKEPLVPIGQKAGWGPRAGLDAVVRRKKNRHPACSPVTILSYHSS